jgi:SAM-dependent methyltransferase
MRNVKNAKFEHTKCIICEADAPDLIYKGRGDQDFEVNVCICKNCGFAYLNPRWDKATYFSFYQKAYDKYWRAYTSPLAPEYNPSSYYPLYRRMLLLDEKIQPQHVLDVGTGSGKHLSYIMQQFPSAKYYTIEPSIRYKAEIEQRNIAFIANDVNAGWNKEFIKKFDFVIMRHVLEHFLEPDKVLIKIREAMATDGILYIAVPDALHIELLRNNLACVHPYIFSEISISNLLKKCGFEIIKLVNGDLCGHDELYLFAKQKVIGGG